VEASNTTTQSVVNTTTLTDLARVALPSDVEAGEVFTFDAWGTVTNNSGVSETPVFTFGIGATVFDGSPAAMTTQTNPRSFWLHVEIAIESPTAQRLTAMLIASTSSAGTTTWGNLSAAGNMLAKTTNMAENLAAGKDIYLRIQFTAANANLRADRYGYVLRRSGGEAGGGSVSDTIDLVHYALFQLGVR
jgi:hypothetical protein